MAIATPDLTTRELVSVGRGVTADIIRGTAVAAGEHLTVQIENGALVARRCLTLVARNDNPPAQASQPGLTVRVLSSRSENV